MVKDNMVYIQVEGLFGSLYVRSESLYVRSEYLYVRSEYLYVRSEYLYVRSEYLYVRSEYQLGLNLCAISIIILYNIVTKFLTLY